MLDPTTTLFAQRDKRELRIAIESDSSGRAQAAIDVQRVGAARLVAQRVSARHPLPVLVHARQAEYPILE